MEDEKTITSKKYTPKVQMMKDALYLNDSVQVRVKRRLAEVKKKSQAYHKKEKLGNANKWHTFSPEMHISGLESSIVNGVGTITYNVYKVDKDGNKESNDVKQVLPSGREMITSSEYIIEKQIVETIEYKKPLKVEEFKY